MHQWENRDGPGRGVGGGVEGQFGLDHRLQLSQGDLADHHFIAEQTSQQERRIGSEFSRIVGGNRLVGGEQLVDAGLLLGIQDMAVEVEQGDDPFFSKGF
jgi:hypothetical protein